jgi:hypothetical protein
MYIHYNKNITDLKNTYCEETKRLRGEEMLYQVRLIFSEPVAVHYSNKLSDDITAKEHTVKSIFFTGADGFANCMDEPETPAVSVYYTNGRQRHSGFSFGWEFSRLVAVEILPENKKDYAKEWQAIADSMKKYNINPDTVEAIEKHLKGEADHITGFQNYWKRTDKPKTMSFADVLEGIVPNAEMPHTGSDPVPVKMFERLKMEAINRVAIREMTSRMTDTESSKGEYKYHRECKRGMKRDRSVSIQVYPDGRVWYYSASEYAGCGNGDYYCMYSPTMAFFTERD